MGDYLCRDESLGIRTMNDCPGDYGLMVKWLSDPEVLEYYEGRSNPYDMERVLAKFAARARGEDYVKPCIIEHGGIAIGYLQYYREDFENPVLEEPPVAEALGSGYKDPYGLDIIIGETEYWNKGLGTRAIRLIKDYLFNTVRADIVLIGPQTRNKRAVRCYEKSGFKPAAVLEKFELHDGKYEDCLIMSAVRLPH